MRGRSIFCTLFVLGSLLAREPVHARHGMVVTQEPLATDVGVSVLKNGGNAVDAAVAIAFALAVTHPSAGNIGGGGFMLVRLADGRTNFLDFRERAPSGASRNMYLDSKGKVTKDSVRGWRASGVPGTVAGLEVAHKKYGKKAWSELVQPAVALAERGFPVSYALSKSLGEETEDLWHFPESKRIFLSAKYGEPLVQPELAETLKRIRDVGAADFYSGETAKKLAAEEKSHGGLITLDDLKDYRVAERAPLRGHYKDYDILTAPPPSSGGIGILQMLGMLEGTGYEKHGAGSAAAIHYVAEAQRRFYADRSEFMGDPDFVKVPVPQLLDPKYIASRRASIDPDRASPIERVRPGPLAPHESTETTHFNVIDAEGNVVAVTYTLNNSYGSGVTVPGLGFLMNDEMDDFTSKPGEPNLFGLIQGEANAIQPGKRPLSSMTPTILLRGGKPFLVLGAPGGSKIINGVLEVILNVVDFHMNVQNAIEAPRFHHQWMPDVLGVEPTISPDTMDRLREMGYNVKVFEGSWPTVARVEAILAKDGWLEGASDGRGSGKAEGY